MADLVVIVMLSALVVVGVSYASLTRMKNDSLKKYLEFYQRQLRSTVTSLDRCVNDLNDTVDAYKELSGRYHELCEAYTAAYEILEENDLLPKDAA